MTASGVHRFFFQGGGEIFFRENIVLRAEPFVCVRHYNDYFRLDHVYG